MLGLRHCGGRIEECPEVIFEHVGGRVVRVGCATDSEVTWAEIARRVIGRPAVRRGCFHRTLPGSLGAMRRHQYPIPGEWVHPSMRVFRGVESHCSVRVPIWILGLPAPSISRHLVETAACAPPELGFGSAWICPALGNIAGTARDDFVGNRAIAGGFEGGPHFEHAYAPTGTQVVHEQARSATVRSERGQVALSEINDVDIVPDSGSIASGVVVSEHPQSLKFANGNLRNIGHQIIGNPVGIFPDPAGWMRSNRVEVSQQGHTPTRIRGDEIRQHLLDHQFGPSIRIGRTHRKVLSNWHSVRIAVHSRRTTEHHRSDACSVHRMNQGDRAAHIIVVIVDRDFGRFSHGLQACEVDNCFDFLFSEQSSEALGVSNIGLNEYQRARRKLLNPGDRSRLAVGEIIDDYEFVAGIQQLNAGM